MSGRRHVGARQRQFVKGRTDDLIAAVPPNMVAGLRKMLAMSAAAGMPPTDAYASVTESLRAEQERHRPHEKIWLVLEAGVLWLARERKNGESAP